MCAFCCGGQKQQTATPHTPTHPTNKPNQHRINNAGTNAYTYGPLVDSDAEALVSIVETNVLGVMLCCKEVRRAGGSVAGRFGGRVQRGASSLATNKPPLSFSARETSTHTHTKKAISLMRSQPRGGHVLNMDGAGADGGATPRFAAYGATKRGLRQLGKSLRAELGMQGIANVGLHDLSPGMVTTEVACFVFGLVVCVSRLEELMSTNPH